MSHKNHTALITGANSGFGFETAVLLAQQGYGHIILACRSVEKAQAARKALIERVGKDVFGILTIDVADLYASKHAALELEQQERKIDLLVLNAGLARQAHECTAQGIEMTLAASLFGHHQFTMDLLAAGKLTPTARIVIAGSEATRGDVPGMKLFDYETIKKHFDGNLDCTMDAVAQGDQPNKYNMNSAYVNAKLWVAWWAASLSRMLPSPMIVVAVSPGSAPSTGLSRHMPALMRWMVIPMLKVIGPKLRMAGTISQGAQRYVDAGEFSVEASGKFWASPPRVLVGTMEEQRHAHITDQHMQDAAWRSVVRLTGVNLPAEFAKTQ